MTNQAAYGQHDATSITLNGTENGTTYNNTNTTTTTTTIDTTEMKDEQGKLLYIYPTSSLDAHSLHTCPCAYVNSVSCSVVLLHACYCTLKFASVPIHSNLYSLSMLTCHTCAACAATTMTQ
jgi:hypothetical protein